MSKSNPDYLEEKKATTALFDKYKTPSQFRENSNII